MNSENNCPFYGYNGMAFPMLIPTDGNQCAMVTVAHSPCTMEMADETPDWRTCPVVAEFRDNPLGGR